MRCKITLSLLVLSAVLAGGCVPTVAAQDTFVSVEVGASFVRLDYDQRPAIWKSSGRAAYSAGVAATKPLRDSNLSLRWGFRFADLGDAHDFAFADGAEERSMSVDGRQTIVQQYVSFPLSLVYDLGEAPFFVSAGIEPGALVRGVEANRHTKSFHDGSSREVAYATAIGPDANRLNVGVTASAGVRFAVMDRELRARLRYGHGLTDTIEQTQERYTRELSILLSYSIF